MKRITVCFMIVSLAFLVAVSSTFAGDEEQTILRIAFTIG